MICEFDNIYSLKKFDSTGEFPLINFQLNNNPENKYIKTVINLEPLKNLNFEKCNSIKIENLTNKENYLINFDKINFNFTKKSRTVIWQHVKKSVVSRLKS